jgi:hypothetical protein
MACTRTGDIRLLYFGNGIINKTWVDILHDLDKNWFSLARKLNKARNVAAHSYDTNKILAVLGKTGQTQQNKQRMYRNA